MADEILKIDENGHFALGGLTNDASLELRNLRVDPSTNRLLVDAGTISASFTSNTEYDEDAAFSNGDTGSFVLGVRQDADTSPVTADGDYHALIFDDSGALKVNVKTSALPSGASTSAKQDTANTSLSSIDGKIPSLGQALETASVPVVLTAAQLSTLTPVSSVTADTELPSAAALSDTLSNPTTPQVGADILLWDAGNTQWLRAQKVVHATNSTGGGIQAVGILAEYDESSPTAITENQFGNIRISANRNLYSTIRDAAGNERGLNIDANGEIGIGAIRTSVTPGTSAAHLGKAEDAAHTTGDTGVMLLAVRESSVTDLSAGNTNGDYEPLQVSATGRLWVSAVVDTALPAGTNAIGKLAANSGVDIGDVDITSILPGTGASNLGKAEDAAHTTGDVGVMMLGVRAASPTERSAGPTDGDYEPPGINEVGALWVSLTPSANGGASTMNASSSDGATALTSTAQAIKASAGNLKGYYIYNPNSSAQFVCFYNIAAASVTVGTTNPIFMLTIPATSAANLWMPDGIKFDTAMSWAATSTAGGNGAPSTALDAIAWYK